MNLKTMSRIFSYEWQQRAVAVLLGAILCSCSPFIYSRGQFKDVLVAGKSREEVRERIGKPIASETQNNGSTDLALRERRDVFKVQGAVTDPMSAGYSREFVRATFGVSEFVFVPYAIYSKIKERKVYRLVVYYDNENRYIRHFPLKEETL